ncbi:MAG TPA: Chromate resistance protein ChrB [Chloroflexota bacterium]|jgi:hypothetical protein
MSDAGVDSAAATVESWVLFVYTVPATPSSKRAAVWREVKRLGAMYLRDGVCVLPDTDAARAGLEALWERIVALDGRGTMVWQARLAPASAAALVAELAQARQAEYAEAGAAAADLLQHVQREAQHHAFDRPELVSLQADLSRLERWLDQIETRDYLRQGDSASVAATLAACRAVLETHASPSRRR